MLVTWWVLSAPAPEASAQTAAFDILEFVVEGNTVLDDDTIQTTIYPFLGEGRQFSDVEGARAALEKAYQDRGFLTVTVDVPEQRVVGGVVLLGVVEGEVGRLAVRGARFVPPGAIRERVPELADGRVPNFFVAEEQLAGLGATAGLRVTPALRPGRTPGTVDVDVNVEDRLPAVFTAELTNHRTVNTEPLRLNLGVRLTNVWQRGHQFGLSLLTAPQDPGQVRVVSANYVVPLADPGASLLAYALASRSDTPTPIGGATVLGGQTVFGARWIQPFQPRFGIVHWATLGLDYKNLRQQDFRELTYWPVFAGYTLLHRDRADVTQLDLGLTAGLRGFGADLAEFADRRFRGDASFAHLRVDASHERALGAWSARGRIVGQYASQPLIPAEQFAVGGSGTVRGYFEVEQFGDYGLAASFELRTPQWPVAGDWRIGAVSFAEAGEVRIRDPLPAQATRATLASVGIGLRVRHGTGLVASLDLAQPQRTTTFTPQGTVRVLGRVAMEF